MWTCLNCGITANINPGNKRVKCSCQTYGEKDKDDIKPEKVVDQPININHSPLPEDVTPVINSDLTPIEICNKCHQYMGKHRCKLIDMGCARTFNQHLRRLDCPLQKWQNIE